MRARGQEEWLREAAGAAAVSAGASADEGGVAGRGGARHQAHQLVLRLTAEDHAVMCELVPTEARLMPPRS